MDEEQKPTEEEDIDWQLKAEECPCHAKNTNICELVREFCNQDVCPFDYWSK